MSGTALQQLLDRIDAVAKAAVPVGTQVFRERADAQSREDAPSVNVKAEDASSEGVSEMDRRELLVLVDIYVRCEPGAMACDDIHGPLHTALMTDSTLRGLFAGRRLVDWTFDYEPADGTSTHKRCRYRFTDFFPAHLL